jgi:hypothetical protein
MKFSLVRPALVLAVSLTLASCGGGGNETYPVNVTVTNALYDGLILTTNGMEVVVPKTATPGGTSVVTFPNGLDYGTSYNVVPKGGTAAAGGGSQPAHQNCVSATSLGYPREYGTAGQTASLESARKAAIEVFYVCSIRTYVLSGTVTGLTSGNLTLINGSTGGQTVVAGSATATSIPFVLPPVQFGASYSVGAFDPEGFHCEVTDGAGEMKEAQEAAGGVRNVAVSCKPTTTP